jgi:hypothetical protein
MPAMRRFIIVCDVLLFFVLPVVAAILRVWSNAERSNGVFPDLPQAVGMQALFLWLRALFCVAVSPAIWRSPAYVVLLAVSLSHQALAASALFGMAFVFGRPHAAPRSSALGANIPRVPSEFPRLPGGSFDDALAFVGVVYVVSMMFALRVVLEERRAGRSRQDGRRAQ